MSEKVGMVRLIHEDMRYAGWPEDSIVSQSKC